MPVRSYTTLGVTTVPLRSPPRTVSHTRRSMSGVLLIVESPPPPKARVVAVGVVLLVAQLVQVVDDPFYVELVVDVLSGHPHYNNPTSCAQGRGCSLSKVNNLCISRGATMYTDRLYRHAYSADTLT